MHPNLAFCILWRCHAHLKSKRALVRAALVDIFRVFISLTRIAPANLFCGSVSIEPVEHLYFTLDAAFLQCFWTFRLHEVLFESYQAVQAENGTSKNVEKEMRMIRNDAKLYGTFRIDSKKSFGSVGKSCRICEKCGIEENGDWL